jgi:hypothetical protein
MKFKCEFPELGKVWYAKPSLAVLGTVPSEDVLRRVWQEVLGKGIRATALCEATQQRRFTAVAFEAGPKTKRLLSKIPLTL